MAGAEEYNSGDQLAEIGGGHSFLNRSATFPGEKSAKPAIGDWMRNQEYRQSRPCITALLREFSAEELGNCKRWMRISRDKVFALLGCYAAYVDSCLYRRFGINYRSHILKMGPTGSPKTSVNNCQHTLRNNPEERRSHLHRGESNELSHSRDEWHTINRAISLEEIHPIHTVTDETSHLR